MDIEVLDFSHMLSRLQKRLHQATAFQLGRLELIDLKEIRRAVLRVEHLGLQQVLYADSSQAIAGEGDGKPRSSDDQKTPN
jgi:hypothetical protein